MEIEDGDHVKPYLLKERGYKFPIAIMRFTFPEGPHYSAFNGSPLVTVIRNSDWGGNQMAPPGSPANPCK